MKAAEAYLLGYRAVEPLEVVVSEEEGLGEGPGRRLSVLLELAHAWAEIPGEEGPRASERLLAEMWCALRELDGQRHALREEVESANAYARLTGEGKLAAQEGRDAAIRRAEEAEAELEGYVAGFAALSLDYREGEADRARLCAQLDALRAMWRLAAASAVQKMTWKEDNGNWLVKAIDERAQLKADNESLRARVAELEADVARVTRQRNEAQDRTADWQAEARRRGYVDTETFEEWRDRTRHEAGAGGGACPHTMVEQPCIRSQDDVGLTRTCREQWRHEMLSRGDAGKGAAA